MGERRPPFPQAAGSSGWLIAEGVPRSQEHQPISNTYGDITATDHSRVHAGNYIVNHFTFVLHRERLLSIEPQERIGLTASMAGLSAQIESLVSLLEITLYPHIMPRWEATDLLDELNESKQLLTGLQERFGNLNLAQDRAALTQADHLIASFTGAVLLFRDLQEDLYAFIHYDPTISDSEYKAAVGRIPGTVSKLREQNETWRTQLEVLTAPTYDRAIRASRNLDRRISSMLVERTELRSRLEGLEHEIHQAARRSKAAASEVMSQLGNAPGEEAPEERVSRLSWTPREFEKVLALSRVYQRHKHVSEVFDFDSSVLRNYSLSDVSLSNISIISVIALPVLVSEVDEEGQWYKDEDLQTIPEAPNEESEDDNETIQGGADTKTDQSLIEEIDRAFYAPETLPLNNLVYKDTAAQPPATLEGLNAHVGWPSRIIVHYTPRALPAPPSRPFENPRAAPSRPFENPRAAPLAPGSKNDPTSSRDYGDTGTPPPVPDLEFDGMRRQWSDSERDRLKDDEETALFHADSQVLPPKTTDVESARSIWSASLRQAKSELQLTLFICASLYDFQLDGLDQDGYPYLTYVAGEMFDVLAQKGELWLARNQDDPKRKLGWIWEKHFAKVITECDSAI